MPHPIPIIIGTTIAVAATGYAFKKFVYDPHLAPVIEAFIEQQRELHHRRRRPVAVSAEARTEREGRNERVEGRSTAVAGAGLRQRRPAELYELDESMAEVGRGPASYTPRRRKPVPPLDEDTLSPFERRAGPVPAPPTRAAAEAVPLISIERDLGTGLPGVSAPVMENPFADSAAARSPTLSPTVSPMPSSVPSRASPVASPALSHTTLIEAPSSPSTSGIDDIDIVSVSGTNTSYIDAESYTPRSMSPMLSPTLSPNPTGSRAASRPLSPALAGSELTFPSPVTPINASMLGSDLTFPAPNIASPAAPASGRGSPARADDVLSVSSWTEDEWRSEADSEWDAVSDAPSR